MGGNGVGSSNPGYEWERSRLGTLSKLVLSYHLYCTLQLSFIIFLCTGMAR